MQSQPFQNTNNKISLIVFVEDPIQTMEPAANYSPEVTFYDWVWDAFFSYAGNKVNLISDKFVSEVADQYQVEHTIATAPIPHSGVKMQIHHLAFPENQMSWLCDFGAKAGATHIVKLRYFSRNVTLHRVTKELNNFLISITINNQPIKYERDFKVLKIMASYQIYDTKKGRVTGSGIFDSSNESETNDTSSSLRNQNSTIKKRLVETIMSQIH